MDSNEKIYELKIEEDDSVSGIQAISLVDSPAIEINWVAFNKERPTHDVFHIPDGQDEIFVQSLLTTGISEMEMLEDGWEIDSVEVVNKKNFAATKPNDSSEFDTPTQRIRYKYILNPEASGKPAIIPTTRNFCKDLINKNYVWRLEDMDATVNDDGQSALVWRGGYNCRHSWAKIVYKKDGNIVNKASININKETSGGFPNDLNPDLTVLGYPQPDTRTSHPSFKKQKKAKEDLDYDVSGLPAYVDQLPKKKRKKIHAHSDYPSGCMKNAMDALEYEKENPDALGITAKHHAVKLSQGQPLTHDMIHKMHSYLSKHKTDVKGKNFSNGGTVYANYMAYGGHEGLMWAGRKIQTASSYTKQYFATDDEQRIVLGPAMIPDLKIFRKDESTGEPYYVFFSTETIKMIAEKYFKNKYIDNNDENHDGQVLPDVFVFESWIKESDFDKSTNYGYKDIPVGYWFVSMKVNNDEVWQKVKSGELKGFSVSGFFEEVPAEFQNEIFLKQLTEILKKYN